jgi:hypothetical protein
MESVEGYHAERITLPLKLASYRELGASLENGLLDSLRWTGSYAALLEGVRSLTEPRKMR